MAILFLDYKQNRRTPGWPDIILLVTGIVVVVYAGIYYLHLFTEIDLLKTKQAVFAHKLSHNVDPRVASLSPLQLRTEVKQANTVLAQLALPWDTLFKDLESSQGGQVALLSIEPDSEKQTVKIVGEAKDFFTMLSYIKFLQQKDSLTQVYLQSHHIEHENAQNPIRFTLAASWIIKR